MIAAAPQRALAEIAEAVAVAERALAEGAEIELAGLDGVVALLCETAGKLPTGERPGFAQELAALAASLDRLAAQITAAQSATRRRRASDAYGGEDSA
jgi:hypothetical protein